MANDGKTVSSRSNTKLVRCCLRSRNHARDASPKRLPTHRTKCKSHKKVHPVTQRWVPNAIPTKQLPHVFGKPAPRVAMKTLRERRQSLTENCPTNKYSTKEKKGAEENPRLSKHSRIKPSNSVNKDSWFVDHYENVQDLLKRIAAIPIKNRPVPCSADTRELGLELKIRLATRAPMLEINLDENDRYCVTAKRVNQRHIPVYELSEEDDPILQCLMKITTKYCHKRRENRP